MSMYEDMAHGQRYFTHIADELPKMLRRALPLSDKREDNFIAGLSMGGMGALKIAMRRPENYSAVCCLSAGHTNYRFHEPGEGTPRFNRYLVAYGEAGPLPSEEETLERARELAESGGPCPRVWHTCGTEDSLKTNAALTRDFFENLPGDPFQYEYHEYTGRHNWDFWEARVPEMLDFVLRAGRKSVHERPAFDARRHLRPGRHAAGQHVRLARGGRSFLRRARPDTDAGLRQSHRRHELPRDGSVHEKALRPCRAVGRDRANLDAHGRARIPRKRALKARRGSLSQSAQGARRAFGGGHGHAAGLFKPCLEHRGIAGLFDALLSVEDVGGRGKFSGRVFTLAAEKLGVEPADCVVFEDVYEGVAGARKAGMRAVLVYDEASAHRHGETEALAERVIHDFTELL